MMSLLLCEQDCKKLQQTCPPVHRIDLRLYVEGTTGKDADGAQRHFDAYAFASSSLRSPAAWSLSNSIIQGNESAEHVVEDEVRFCPP